MNARCCFACGLVVLALTLPIAAAEKLPEVAQAVLEKAEQLELLSLDPTAEKPDPKEDFHGYKVLGKTTLKEAEGRKTLLNALGKGLKDAPNFSAGCYRPRHGIRATQDGKTVDLVICFECISMQVYIGDKREAWPHIAESPQPTFDKILKDAKVPLAPKP